MNIAVLSGSPRRKDSYSVIKRIEEKMNATGDVAFEYLKINEYNVKECLGCLQCIIKSEKLCPLKDDVSAILDKLKKADGLIFASPVYAISITGTMKKLVDRLSYVFHRPELILKPALTVVTTYGGGVRPTQKYLKMMATGWGCNYKGDLSVASPRYFENSEYYSQKYKREIDSKINTLANRFYQSVVEKNRPVPSFYELYLFQGFKGKSYASKADYDFWKERNWLESDYYYEVKLNPLKKLFANTLEWLIKKAFERYYKS